MLFYTFSVSCLNNIFYLYFKKEIYFDIMFVSEPFQTFIFLREPRSIKWVVHYAKGIVSLLRYF